MQKIDKKKLYRILDANFNRAKEGLRVCEDTCRFFCNDRSLTKRYKNVRHQLTDIAESLGILRALDARDIDGDVGKRSTATELKRRTVADIFYANSQRVKESVRVLEEFAKLADRRPAGGLKKVRYRIYALEKAMARKIRIIPHSRQGRL